MSSNVFLWQLTQKLPKRPEPVHDDDDHDGGHGHSHGGVPCGGHGHGHGHAQKRLHGHSHSHGGGAECAEDHSPSTEIVPEPVPVLLERVSVRVNTGVVGITPSLSFA